MHIVSGVQNLTDSEMCSKNLWNLYCVAHKMQCNLFLPRCHYPCCGDVNIDQLETYMATEIMQVKIGRRVL